MKLLKKPVIYLLLFSFLFVIKGSLTLAKEEENLESYKEFVTTVGNEIIKILVNRSTSLSNRKEEFRQVLRRDFSIPAIGKFVLAAYWRRANEAQKKEYLELFENAIVENYSAQFDNYSNEKLKVEGARQAKDGGVIVKSTVVRPAGGDPLNVDWKVFDTKEGKKILDLIVNGVSMSITQRSEYRAIIQANGGSIDGLLKALKDPKPTKKS